VQVGEHYMQMGEAQTYMREQYGVRWSRPFIVKLIHEGKLRAIQPGGERGWWYISREAIDELLTTP
jgi:excisionase family DNA binding protein